MKIRLLIGSRMGHDHDACLLVRGKLSTKRLPLLSETGSGRGGVGPGSNDDQWPSHTFTRTAGTPLKCLVSLSYGPRTTEGDLWDVHSRPLSHQWHPGLVGHEINDQSKLTEHSIQDVWGRVSTSLILSPSHPPNQFQKDCHCPDSKPGSRRLRSIISCTCKELSRDSRSQINSRGVCTSRVSRKYHWNKQFITIEKSVHSRDSVSL